MTEIGYITDIHGEYASVAFKRKSGCGDNCATCKSSCSAKAGVSVEVKNTLNANVGDQVKVSIEGKLLNKMITLAYVFPLIMLFVGIGVGINIFKGMGNSNYELLSFLLGMVFLAVSYVALNLINKNKAKNKEYVLEMIDIMR